MEDRQALRWQLSMLEEKVIQWEQRLQADPGGVEAFGQAVAELRAALDGIGRAGFQRLARAREIADPVVLGDGQLYRFKQVVPKEWMTLWGTVVVPRRLYQADRGGPSRVPLDERCGMRGRFLVPELERVVAFLGARLVPSEVEDSLQQVLAEAPSRTAIQHVLAAVGQWAEDGAEQLELVLSTTAPLAVEGDTLVTSWDGVLVPLRESGPKQGRPAERPQATPSTSSDPSPTVWKEAGVGLVATYQTPLDPDHEDPERVDVRYAARMPEKKMTTLVQTLVDRTAEALQRGQFLHRVVLADGRREIWRTIDAQPVFEDFTRILDFYHGTQHLSKAAEQLFGKSSTRADCWFRSWQHKLRYQPGAVEGVIRSIAHHRRKLPSGGPRQKAATTELRFFRRNRDKMDYAGYRALGLIISSGPVEAAAKTLVGHRLKRSGMRWTRIGGQRILNLRLQVQSQRWNPFWDWYQKTTTSHPLCIAA